MSLLNLGLQNLKIKEGLYGFTPKALRFFTTSSLGSKIYEVGGSFKDCHWQTYVSENVKRKTCKARIIKQIENVKSTELTGSSSPLGWSLTGVGLWDVFSGIKEEKSSCYSPSHSWI